MFGVFFAFVLKMTLPLSRKNLDSCALVPQLLQFYHQSERRDEKGRERGSEVASPELF